MEGFYYLGMLIGIVWLCIWAGYPKLLKGYPSPFDMREDYPSAPTGEEGRYRRASASAAAPPADLHDALPEPGPARSWRVRREQASAPRRERRG